MLWMRIKNLWLLIQLKFYSILLSILSGFTCKLKVKHDGAVIARDRLKDGGIAEIYIKDGKYERRIIEDFNSYHFDVNCAFIDDYGAPHVKHHEEGYYSSDKTLRDVCEAHKLPYEDGQIALNGEIIPKEYHTMSIKALCEKYGIDPISTIYFSFFRKTGS